MNFWWHLNTFNVLFCISLVDSSMWYSVYLLFIFLTKIRKHLQCFIGLSSKKHFLTQTLASLLITGRQCRKVKSSTYIFFIHDLQIVTFYTFCEPHQFISCRWVNGIILDVMPRNFLWIFMVNNILPVTISAVLTVTIIVVLKRRQIKLRGSMEQ